MLRVAIRETRRELRSRGVHLINTGPSLHIRRHRVRVWGPQGRRGASGRLTA